MRYGISRAWWTCVSCIGCCTRSKRGCIQIRGGNPMSIARLAPAMLVFLVNAAAGQGPAYPVKPVRIVVPSSPGGGTDILARVLAQKMSESLGQQFVVENRPGAGQVIGIEAVAHSAPDGYTLLMAASAIVINEVLYAKPPYDTLREF